MWYFSIKAERKQREVEILQLYNRSLLTNILPTHVIKHFLNPSINSTVCHFVCMHIMHYYILAA